MKKLVSIIIVIFLTTIACSTHKDVQVINHGTITVTGIASEENKAGRAFVLADTDSIPYYIDKLYTWPDSINGKHIKVTGKHITIDKQKLFDKDTFARQVIPYQHILKKASWEVIE